MGKFLFVEEIFEEIHCTRSFIGVNFGSEIDTLEPEASIWERSDERRNDDFAEKCICVSILNLLWQ